jgi:hypothetical protein
LLAEGEARVIRLLVWIKDTDTTTSQRVVLLGPKADEKAGSKEKLLDFTAASVVLGESMATVPHEAGEGVAAASATVRVASLRFPGAGSRFSSWLTSTETSNLLASVPMLRDRTLFITDGGKEKLPAPAPSSAISAVDGVCAILTKVATEPSQVPKSLFLPLMHALAEYLYQPDNRNTLQRKLVFGTPRRQGIVAWLARCLHHHRSADVLDAAGCLVESIVPDDPASLAEVCNREYM